MTWPKLECEWCGEEAEMVHVDEKTWEGPGNYVVIHPPTGYTGGYRIAHKGVCADAVSALAKEEADKDATGAPMVSLLALSVDEDRWQKVS